MGDKKTEWAVDDIPLGELISTLDTENRWAYSANLNVPPCDSNVYYNVLRNVYPIKQEHYDLINAQIHTLAGVPQSGNFRVTQPLNGHSVQLFYKDRTPISPETLTNDF